MRVLIDRRDAFPRLPHLQEACQDQEHIRADEIGRPNGHVRPRAQRELRHRRRHNSREEEITPAQERTQLARIGYGPGAPLSRRRCMPIGAVLEDDWAADWLRRRLGSGWRLLLGFQGKGQLAQPLF